MLRCSQTVDYIICAMAAVCSDGANGCRRQRALAECARNGNGLVPEFIEWLIGVAHAEQHKAQTILQMHPDAGAALRVDDEMYITIGAEVNGACLTWQHFGMPELQLPPAFIHKARVQQWTSLVQKSLRCAELARQCQAQKHAVPVEPRAAADMDELGLRAAVLQACGWGAARRGWCEAAAQEPGA